MEWTGIIVINVIVLNLLVAFVLIRYGRISGRYPGKLRVPCPECGSHENVHCGKIVERAPDGSVVRITHLRANNLEKKGSCL